MSIMTPVCQMLMFSTMQHSSIKLTAWVQGNLSSVPLPCGPNDAPEDQVYDLHAAHEASGMTDFDQVSHSQHAIVTAVLVVPCNPIFDLACMNFR